MSASAEVDEGMRTPDFADVYRERLVSVWRYVRSRVPGYHEAQDVTSDVFVRAWRAWHRFDPSRGPVGAWLFGIARIAVADWRRKAPDEALLAAEAREAQHEAAASPEGLALYSERLSELANGLRRLGERERDALALRFGAGLKMQEVGQVMDVSTAAAKMIVYRAVRRLSEAMQEEVQPGGEAPADLLDGLIEGVLGRPHPSMSQDRLRELLYHLCAAHQPDLPDGLARRVSLCVDCEDARRNRSGPEVAGAGGLMATLRFPSRMGLGWAAALSPVCIGCTVQAAVLPLMAAGLGLSVLVPLHLVSLLTAPGLLVVLWRRYRRHHDPASLRLGVAGAALVTVHLVTHFIAEGSWVFVASDIGGTLAMVASVLVDWRAMQRFMERQRLAMRRLAVEVSA